MFNVKNALRSSSTLGKVLMPAIVMASVSIYARAQDQLRPFELAYTTSGNMADVAAQIKQKLAANGFEVVGSYAPLYQ